MKFYLSLTNPNDQLTADIADAINAIYPLGISNQSEEYRNYPGIQRIERLVGEHMTNYNAYIKPWKTFLANLPKGFKSKIHNSGFVHEFAYSGELTLEKYEDASLIRVQKIIFSVSWLAKFYTICGMDETVIKKVDNGRTLHYSAINAITVSPMNEFENGFNYIKDAIDLHFNDYQFIPFRKCTYYIKEVQKYYDNTEESTVYNALFNDSLEYRHLPHLRGDL